MQHDIGGNRSFTKAEATNLIGKTVHLNSGDDCIVTDIACEGPNQYMLIVDGKYYVNKSCKNGLYVC